MRTVQRVKDIFESLAGENRSAIRAVAELCNVAVGVERLECFSDETGVFRVYIDEVEKFQWAPDGARDNIRNLLAVMFAFATQYAEQSLSPDISVYKINCIVNVAEFCGKDSFLRLEVVNTASEQHFVLSKV